MAVEGKNSGGGGGGGGKGKSSGGDALSPQQKALRTSISLSLDQMPSGQRSETLIALKSNISSQLSDFQRELSSVNSGLSREARKRDPAGVLVSREARKSFLIEKIAELKGSMQVLASL